jgi:hypothetical protein
MISQNVFVINTKLNLSTKSLNDQIYFSLRRMFDRYGTNSNIKVGLINSITKDGKNTTVQINDLSGVYSRVKAIAMDESNDFNDASNEEKLAYGFVLDDETLTPDNTSEDDLGNNLIG